MVPVTRILVALAVAAGSALGVNGTASEPGATSADVASSITVHDVDPRWVPDINADLAVFEQAGLRAVSVDVHVWDGVRRHHCRGFAGFFDPSAPRLRVDLCLDYHDSELGTHLRHKLILHELAHAWVHANTVEADREGFMALRGIGGWNDPTIAHYARGTEVAANTLVAMLHPDDPASVKDLCGYELLTGATSRSGRADPCVGQRRST